MTRTITLHVEKLPEGVYLVTSDDVQGLVVQAPTLAEGIDWGIANAKLLLEAQGVGNVGLTFADSSTCR